MTLLFSYMCRSLLTACWCCRGDSLDRLARLPLRAISMRECPLICDASLARLSAVAALEQLSLDMCGRITDRGARQQPTGSSQVLFGVGPVRLPGCGVDASFCCLDGLIVLAR